MVEWVQQADGIWQYIALFLISMLPLLDVFFIIPVGIVIGMSPVAVGIIAFLGNFIMVLIFVIFFRQISKLLKKRKEKKGKLEPSKRETRARHIWEKYGLPVFAILSPGLVGTDLAAVTALLLGSSKTKVITWFGISLVIWSIFMVIGSVYSFKHINSF